MPGSSLQAEMSSIEAQIAWHYAKIAVLKAKRNSLAPICSLPTELLRQIFTIYALETDDPFSLKWTSQIMYVCHHWRNLAMATQPLWAFFQTGYSSRRAISRFYNQLERSGAAPLTLKFQSYDSYYTRPTLDNSSRVKGLAAHGEAKSVYELIRSLPEHDFSILSSVDFEPSYKRDELPEGFVQALPNEILDGRLPRLQQMTMHSIALPWSFLRSLTSLCLTDCGNSASVPHTFDIVLATLTACPQLHTLKLDGSIPPPLLDQNYPTVELMTLAWISLRDISTTCAMTLNHLRFPSTTSVHVFPYGVRTGPDVSDVLITIRKHLRAPGAATTRLMVIEGTVRTESSHYTTSLFHDTAPPNRMDSHTERCPFTLNSHPTNEAELRRIMTKVFKAIPFESITHLDAQLTTMTPASWKAALRLLPALKTVYLTQMDDITASFCGALSQIEQLDSAHKTFPRIRRLDIRIFSLARLRAIRGDPEEREDFVALVLAPLQTYLRAAFDNGNALEVLDLDDRDRVLMRHEGEMDGLFPFIGREMSWNQVVYDPAKRKAEMEAWEVERREFAIKHGIEYDG
ncbi:hypothetical protein C8R43DRAFT_965395 [Mycena crocata]|nr:hypothetical protein C8R43DRAFT_965395 [Mycena crocata]